MSQRRLPAEVYWRRRLLVLAVLIALVWVGLRLIGDSSDDSPTSGSPTAKPTATAVTPTVAAPVDGVVDVTLVSATRTCDPEKIRMTPSVEPKQRTKGPVTIGLVVSSTESTACTLTPQAADLVAVVSANKSPVWDSTVCKTSLLTSDVQVSPEWGTLVDATWSGRGSGSKCSPKEGWASPGDYTVQVGTLGGEPGKASFTLTAKPEPKPTRSTRTPKPPKGTTKPAD